MDRSRGSAYRPKPEQAALTRPDDPNLHQTMMPGQQPPDQRPEEQIDRKGWSHTK